MTELVIDDRPIAAASPLYGATLVRREDLTDSLAFFWVKPDGPFIDFEPGQYLTIGVESNGKLIQRPYSVASSPRARDDGYEFYVRLVTGGMFTPLLWRAADRPGHEPQGPQGQVRARARRRADARLHQQRHGHRAVRLDDVDAALRRSSAARHGAPRRLVRRRAGLPRAGRGLGRVGHVPGELHPDRLPAERRAQRRLVGADRAGSRRSCPPSSTSWA